MDDRRRVASAALGVGVLVLLGSASAVAAERTAGPRIGRYGEPVRMKSLGESVVLDGNWRALVSDAERLPPPEAPGWFDVRFPLDAEATQRLGKAHQVWLVREVALPEGTLPTRALDLRDRRFAVSIGYVIGAVQIFADEVRIGQVGWTSAGPGFRERPRLRAFEVPARVLEDGRVILAIRSWLGVGYRAAGRKRITGEPFRFGPKGQIEEGVGRIQIAQDTFSLVRYVFLLAIFAGAAGVFFWLFLRRREMVGLLAFAGFLAAYAVQQVNYLATFFGWLEMALSHRLLPLLTGIEASLFIEFISRFLRGRAPGRLTRGVQVFVLVTTVLEAFAGSYLIQWIPRAYLLGFAVLIAAWIWGDVLILAVRGNRDARTIALGLSIFLGLLVYEYITFPFLTLVPLASLALVFCMSLSIAQSFVRSLDTLDATHRAAMRFVPEAFLELLGRRSLTEVRYGDATRQEITVMFSDIRGFTTLSERLSADRTFGFINRYLGLMQPVINAHGGFIGTYLGDGMMALFPRSADDAVRACLAMAEELRTHQAELDAEAGGPVRVGMGLHFGSLMLGTIGGRDRIDCTVIGDTVNLAARLEGVTKRYGAALIISGETRDALGDPGAFVMRAVDRVLTKGKELPVTLWEVLDALAPEERARRVATAERFARATEAYRRGAFAEAKALFDGCLAEDPEDLAARTLAERSVELAAEPPADWDGVTRLSSK